MAYRTTLYVSLLLSSLSRAGSLDVDDGDTDFLLAADVGAAGLHHLQVLLSTTYRGAAFYAHITAAEMHAQHGRIPDAADSYSYVLSNYALDDRDAAPVHLALGNALSHLSRSADAEAEYRHAAQARKYAHLAYYCLGLLYARSGRTADAVQSLETALFFRPAFFSAVHALGSLHIIRGNVEKGLRMYENALQLLVDSGVLPASVENDEDGAAAPATGANSAQAAQAAMQAQHLGDHLVRHVLHVFKVPSDVVPASDSASRAAGVLALGRSLRAFLTRVSSLDLAAFHRALGIKLADTGALQDGLAHMRRAVSLYPAEFGYLLLWTTLAQPLSYIDGQDVWTSRARTVKNVRQALEDRVTVVHPERLFELYQLQYQLPFSGLPAHRLMRDIGRLFAASEVPVLPYSAPRLYTDYPRAIAATTGKTAATSNARADIEATGEAAIPSSTDEASYKAIPDSPFRLPQPSNLSRSKMSGAGADSTPWTGTPAVIAVGLVSYQTHDCPVGHLFHRLAHHLKGYAKAVEQAKKKSANFDIFAQVSRSPSMGGGTRTQHSDPLAESGYVLVPGVARFNITLIRLSKGGDNVTIDLIRASDQTIWAGSRPFDLESARKALTDARLDVLIAADPGIQPEIYALLFGRVAPIQVAVWGQGDMAHTLSLGLENSVDFYVVGDAGAADGLQDHMLEQTVRLGDGGVFFPHLRPILPDERFAASRRHGLLEGRHLYLVPATLNALHPAFDDVLLGVLAADPAGEALCLYEQGQELWLATTRERLARHPLAISHGLSILQRMRFTHDFVHAAHRDKWALMSAAEVVLDTFPVGLGLTALETLEVGTPLVTLPSRQPMRPFAAGALHRMNLTQECVATSVQDFIAKAVALATDPVARRAVRSRLLARRPLIEWSELSNHSSAGGRHGSGAQEDRTSAFPAPLAPEIDAENKAWLAEMASSGYVGTASGTLNDWLAFLGRVGRPWAVDRQRVEAEASKRPVRAAERKKTVSGAKRDRAGGANRIRPRA